MTPINYIVIGYVLGVGFCIGMIMLRERKIKRANRKIIDAIKSGTDTPNVKWFDLK